MEKVSVPSITGGQSLPAVGSKIAVPVSVKPGHGYDLVMKADPQTESRDFPKAKSLDYVGSVQISRSWKQLNPKQGQYDWTSIETAISARGKKNLVIVITTSGPEMVPDWFWSLLGPTEFLIDTATGIKYPIFWNAKYEEHVDNFIKAFGARFNGNRGIEYVRTGGWQTGSNEPSLYGSLTQKFQAMLSANGLLFPVGSRKPTLNGTDPYTQSTLRRMETWKNAMPGTRLAATFHFPGEDATSLGFDQAMVNFACANKWVLGNTGLNYFDKSSARIKLLSYRNSGAQIGWFGLTHTDPAQWDTMLTEAIGDATHLPVIPLSYLTVNADDSPDHDIQLRAFAEKLK